MGTAGGRRGRRDNGLMAVEYAVAGDVDPRVGEHLLDVLAGDGIAAYLQPAADLHPITRTTTIPARPTDRLYVDRKHVSTAQEYLSRLAEPDESRSPESVSSDPVDDDWARIVAGFHTETAAGPTPWPEAEDIDRGRSRSRSRSADLDPTRSADLDPTHAADFDPTGHDPARQADPARSADPQRGGDPERPGDPAGPMPFRAAVLRGGDEPSLLDGLDTFGADLPDDDEGTYVPPTPPPLPRPSKQVVFAVIAIVAGFILFFRPEVALIDDGLARLAGFISAAAGVAALIWRLRPGDEDDERRPDDGAVV